MSVIIESPLHQNGTITAKDEDGQRQSATKEVTEDKFGEPAKVNPPLDQCSNWNAPPLVTKNPSDQYRNRNANGNHRRCLEGRSVW